MLAQKMTEIVNTLNEALADAMKADNGNKAATRRVRVVIQEARRMLQEARASSLGKDEPAGE